MDENNVAGLSRRVLCEDGETIVSRLMAKTLANPNLISLAAGFVDPQTLPEEATRRALEAMWADTALARSALQYGTTIGHPPLRAAILERMLAADRVTAAAIHADVGQVVLTAGSNQLLYLLSECLLDPGDIVLCGAPSYFVFMDALASLGARSVGVEVDAEGIIPEALEAEFARLAAHGEAARVKALYVTTYYDNPSGVTVSAARREELLGIVQRRSGRNKIYIIEDAAYRELRYYGDDVPSLRSCDVRGDTVIHAGTFSKSYSPGIRVGWGIIPPALLKPLVSLKGHLDFGSPHFNQVLMQGVLETGLFDRHVAKIREVYRAKLEAMLVAAAEFLAPIAGVSWQPPRGGLYLWLRLPEGLDAGPAGPLFDRAVAEGVLYVPGQCCYPQRGPRPGNVLRLSFGIPTPAEIRQGIAALGRAIREVL